MLLLVWPALPLLVAGSCCRAFSASLLLSGRRFSVQPASQLLSSSLLLFRVSLVVGRIFLSVWPVLLARLGCLSFPCPVCGVILFSCCWRSVFSLAAAIRVPVLLAGVHRPLSRAAIGCWLAVDSLCRRRSARSPGRCVFSVYSSSCWRLRPAFAAGRPLLVRRPVFLVFGVESLQCRGASGPGALFSLAAVSCPGRPLCAGACAGRSSPAWPGCAAFSSAGRGLSAEECGCCDASRAVAGLLGADDACVGSCGAGASGPADGGGAVVRPRDAALGTWRSRIDDRARASYWAAARVCTHAGPGVQAAWSDER